MQFNLARDNVTALGRNMLASVASMSAAKIPAVGHTPRDKSIVGMVEKGHTPDAIASFLGILTIDLVSRLYRLDLHTPHNGSIRRKVRKNNARSAWQLAEIRQLVELREQNVSSVVIAEKLGRSVGSVRYKARWLGLPKLSRGKHAAELPLFPNLDTTSKPRRKPRIRLCWCEDHLRVVIDPMARLPAPRGHRPRPGPDAGPGPVQDQEPWPAVGPRPQAARHGVSAGYPTCGGTAGPLPHPQVRRDGPGVRDSAQRLATHVPRLPGVARAPARQHLSRRLRSHAARLLTLFASCRPTLHP